MGVSITHICTFEARPRGSAEAFFGNCDLGDYFGKKSFLAVVDAEDRGVCEYAVTPHQYRTSPH